MCPIILSRVEQHTKSKIIEDDEDEEDQETVKIENDGKLIEAEKIRKGKVILKNRKLRCKYDKNQKKFKVHASTLFIYLKNCSLVLFVLYCISHALMNVSSVLWNFWLSDWTDANIADVTNSTSQPMSRDMRIVIYSLLGLSQSRYIKS